MTTSIDQNQDQCDGCGLDIEGGTGGCHQLFEEQLAKQFTQPHSSGLHRMMVDTYCLQHPERYCRSSKSLAAHLVSLCAMTESEAGPGANVKPIREWLNGRSPVEKPELPPSRGELTIGHVQAVDTPERHAAAVEEWARSTWEAYAPLHDLARDWLEQAMGNGKIEN